MHTFTTVFAQFLSVVPRYLFVKLSKEHRGKRSPRTFLYWDQFVHLLHAQLAGCKSLRDGIMGMNAAAKRLYHLGTKPVSKSTFADANNMRPYTFFEALFGELYRRCLPKAPGKKFSFKNKLFSLDASVVDLCLTLFPWAKFRTTKAGIKLHTLLDHDGYLPAVVTVTEAKCHEVNMAKLLQLPKGSIVVFDRGYVDHAWFRQLCKTDVFLVTRLKSNARFIVLERNEVDRTTGVTSDQTIQVADGEKALVLRRVGYRDQETGKRFEFLTNHMTLSARTIADIYKERWQVEIFFRFIKQNLKIKTFLGNSKNAVLSQVYVALIAYLLLAYQKFLSKIGLSLHYLARLVQRNLMQQCEILDLVDPRQKRSKFNDSDQLTLLP
ncbi:IS4 family transposase [Desulfolutivibrio sulfoxidireducens]|uniref:IS4 family transposase n=1 Tax=Desulfolutivibrio sulfoxidireducens TaxID=2773299 RepID=UPI00159EB6EE|nr:IS4 family transposase [Desulfolutivibrio sulfoxidireducens]QLA16729.1 IS4 family transposase [Desulfolutivibrio sulfoxidireducens]